jgi:hypothetical protein
MTDMCRLISFSSPAGRKAMLLSMLALCFIISIPAWGQTATLSSPSNGSTNVWSPVLFSWSPVANATAYYLYVGSTPGAKDVVDTGEIVTTSVTAALPSGTYYARLHTLAGGVWSHAQDVSFTVSPSPTAATITSPLDGATQVATLAQFTWTAVQGAAGYRLLIGSSLGSSDIFQSAVLTGTSVSVRLADSTRYFVQLQTIFGGQSVSSFSSFTTAVVPAVLLSPANGASQVSATPYFSWNAPRTASAYQILIGSQPGGSDILSSGILTTNQLSFALPKAGQYYVRLRSNFYGAWYFSDSTFSSGNFATMIYPTDGALHVNPSVQFSWNAVAEAQAYYLYVGNTPRSLDVFNSGATASTTAAVQLAPGRRYYATIWTELAGIWVPSDISFVTDTGSARMLYPKDDSLNIPTQSVFGWSAVPDATGYQIDVGTTSGASDVFSSGNVQTNTISVPGLQPQTAYFIHLTTFKSGAIQSVDSSFTSGDSGTGIAQMIYPPDGATNVDVSQIFSWTSVADAQAYYLHVGTAPWLGDIFDSTEIQSTSVSIPLNRFTSGKYYLFVSSLKAGVWQSVQTTFTVGDRAGIVTPANQAVDVDPLAPIRWTGFQGARAYYLYVGTIPGAKDVYDSGETLDFQRFVPKLQPGVTYYLRLHTLTGNGWLYVDSSFTAGTGLARLTQPVDGTVNADATAPFVWNALPDAQLYYLTIGSKPGARDIFDHGPTTLTAAFVTGLAPGNTYYVRLYTEKYNQWRYVDSTFQISPPAAGSGPVSPSSFLVPANGDTVVDPFAAFTWTAVPGASYVLHIGTTLGAWDSFDSGQISSTTSTPFGLAYGKQYYARLWLNQNNQWSFTDIVFQTETSSQDPNLLQRQAAFYSLVKQTTASVRMMADFSNIPLPNTPLAEYLQTLGLSSATCSQFAAMLISQLQGAGIASRIRNITLTGTSFESHTTVEYYDPFFDKWPVADPTFGLLLTDSATGTGLSVEQVSSLVNAGQFSSITPVYITQNGAVYAKSYYMDPISLYANPTPIQSTGSPFGPQQNPAEPFLNLEGLATDQGRQGVYLFHFQTATDTLDIYSGAATVHMTPINGTLWSKAINLPNEWVTLAVPAGVEIYEFRRVMF